MKTANILVIMASDQIDRATVSVLNGVLTVLFSIGFFTGTR